MFGSIATPIEASVSGSGGWSAPGHRLADDFRQSENVLLNRLNWLTRLPVIEDRPWGGVLAGRNRRNVPASEPALSAAGAVESSTPATSSSAASSNVASSNVASSNPTSDDVAIQPVARYSFTIALEQNGLESALRRCASPFVGLVRDAEVLYSVSNDRRFSPKAREYMQLAGQVMDLASGLHPNIGLVQGVCSVSARALEIQRGSAPSDEDVLGLTFTLKGMNGYAQRHPSQIVKATYPVRRTALEPAWSRRLQTRTKTAPSMQQLWVGSGPIREAPLAIASMGRERGGNAPGASVSHNNDAPGPAATFELHYEEGAEAALEAGAKGKDGTTVDRSPMRIDRPAHEMSLDAASEAAPEAAMSRKSSDGTSDVVEAVGGGQSSLETGRNAVGGSAHQIGPRYTTVGSVPLQFVSSGPDGRPRWRPVPLSAYRSDLPARGHEGRPFTVSGHMFIELAGWVYPYYTTHAGSGFIHSDADPRLPPWPLQRRNNRYVLQSPQIDVAAGVMPVSGRDGYIRVNNKRYIVYNEEVVEAAPPLLIAEVQIRQFAVSIPAWLPAPDAGGFIRFGGGDTLIEGSHGYYFVHRSAADGPVYLLDPLGVETGIRLHYDAALHRWAVDPDLRQTPLFRLGHRDSLQIYQATLGESVFLKQRPALREAVSKALAQLDAFNLFRPNRLSPHPSGDASVKGIFAVREDIAHRLSELSHWNALSVRAKQTVVSRITYGQFIDSQEATIAGGSQAFCSEMLDAMQAILTPYVEPDCMLQIMFKEFPGSGRTHVALLFADDPAVFDVFGDINVPGPGAALKVLEHPQFADWVLARRNAVAIIDPWGPEKVVDFSSAASRGDVELILRVNLREAKFDVGPDARYRVSAVDPTRDLKASRRAFDHGTVDAYMPCLLLGSCKR